MGNVEVRKNEEGYELNLNALIYSELLMRKQTVLLKETNSCPTASARQQTDKRGCNT